MSDETRTSANERRASAFEPLVKHPVEVETHNPPERTRSGRPAQPSANDRDRDASPNRSRLLEKSPSRDPARAIQPRSPPPPRPAARARPRSPPRRTSTLTARVPDLRGRAFEPRVRRRLSFPGGRAPALRVPPPLRLRRRASRVRLAFPRHPLRLERWWRRREGLRGNRRGRERRLDPSTIHPKTATAIRDRAFVHVQLLQRAPRARREP